MWIHAGHLHGIYRPNIYYHFGNQQLRLIAGAARRLRDDNALQKAKCSSTDRKPYLRLFTKTPHDYLDTCSRKMKMSAPLGFLIWVGQNANKNLQRRDPAGKSAEDERHEPVRNAKTPYIGDTVSDDVQ
jgi:hypothetical protein